LDATGIHPECLTELAEAAGRAGVSLDAPGPALAAALRNDKTLEESLGAATVADIAAELDRFGQDPRGRFVPFSFRDDVREVKDLKEGMACPGLVTNVTNFGAFVDIGVGHDGLVHLSEFGERFVPDPRKVVSPGDRVNVRVLKVDHEKKQISLTMKRPPRPKADPRARLARPRPEASGEAAGATATRQARPHRREGARPGTGDKVRPNTGGDRPRPASADQPSGERPRGDRPRAAERPRTADRPAGSRPPGSGGAPRSDQSREARPRPESRPASAPSRAVFNNPFAVLASLKDDLKKKP
jgi:uncharacterized protein